VLPAVPAVLPSCREPIIEISTTSPGVG